MAAPCIRRAWLEWNGRTLPLEDDLAGYACTELDLGYPEVREVMNPRAGANGTIDRTELFGARAVSANLRAYGGTMTPDEAAAMWAPVMVPSTRATLHYVLDRPGAPERMCVVRPSGYTWPVSGKRTREIHLGWVAADPRMLDPAQSSATSYSGSATTPGRVYDLAYDRRYPAGGGAATTGTISSPGDTPVRPLIRIYGPITNPHLAFTVHDPYPAVIGDYSIAFVAGFRIDPGSWVDLDTELRTAVRDDGSSVLPSIDWQTSEWPVIPPAPASAYMNLTGESATGVTQAVAYWHDGYLT